MSADQIVVADLNDEVGIVGQVTGFWSANEASRINQIEAWDEVRKYVFAEDADNTSGMDTPWHNRTTRPKLTWIYDKMLSAYMKRLFPSDDFFRWKGAPGIPETTAAAIQRLVANKLRQPEAQTRASVEQCISDFILFGNTFAGTEYITKTEKSFSDGKETVVFRGPRPFRISPWDVVIDPAAASYDESPIAYRTVERRDYFIGKNLGDERYAPDVMEKMMRLQNGAPIADSVVQHIKDHNIQIDGINLIEWWERGRVEIIDYFGPITILAEDGSVTYEQNKHVVILDRTWAAVVEDNPSWMGIKPIVFAGYRAKPDNLWAMGPLANLVGMQYRIDHLENAKSDALDLSVYPIRKITGDVSEEAYPIEPGAEWFVPLNGDIELLYPDPRTLMFDQDIMLKEQEMEEFAGVPRETAGFRTPGEKTQYEVSKLLENAGEMPDTRIEKFESTFLQPLLNLMLEQIIRNLDSFDLASLKEEDVEAWQKLKITDLKQDGRLYPIGSKHAKQRADKVNNLVNMAKLGMELAPEHVAILKILNKIEFEMGLDEDDVVGMGYGLEEEMMTTMRQQQMEQQFQQTMEGMNAQVPATAGRRRRETEQSRGQRSQSSPTGSV